MKWLKVAILSVIFSLGGTIRPTIAGGIMNIRISFDDTVISGVLNDSETAQDLWNKLPLKLDFYPHQSREVYADIDLTKKAPVVDSYELGDIAYWTPGNTLVLYFGPGYTDQLIIMGKMTSDYGALKKISGKTSLLIERAE